MAMMLTIAAALLAVSGQSGPSLPSPKAAAAELEAGNYAAAERDYRLIVSRYPRMAGAYNNLGISYFLQKKYQQAAETLRQGLKLDPEMANAWLFLGMSQLDLNEPSKAIPSLRQYISMNPADAEGHYYLGICLLSLDRDQEAAEALGKAREIDPKNTDVLYHLAECFVHLAQGKGANLNTLQAAFQRTIGEIAAIDPNSIRLRQLQAGYYEATGDSKKAISELEEVVKTHPHVQGVYYTLGCFYLKEYHYDQALEQFKAELALDSPYPRTYLQIGRTYTDMREPEKALPFLEQAIRMEPGQATPWVQVGRTHLRMNEFDKAASALEKAIQLGDRSASTYFLLSNAYRGMGKLDLAQQAVKKSEEASREQSNKVIEHLREVAGENKPDDP